MPLAVYVYASGIKVCCATGVTARLETGLTDSSGSTLRWIWDASEGPDGFNLHGTRVGT